MATNSILTKTVISAVFFCILAGAFASAAFGVGFPYKISLHPGETYEGSFSIQNVLEPTEDTTISIVVEKGQEYIQFPEGTTIQLSKGETKNIPVKITIPERGDADKYNVQILFQPTSAAAAGQEGTIELVLALKKSFDIEVIRDKSNKAVYTSIALVLIAVILIIILMRVLKNSKKKR